MLLRKGSRAGPIRRGISLGSAPSIIRLWNLAQTDYGIEIYAREAPKKLCNHVQPKIGRSAPFERSLCQVGFRVTAQILRTQRGLATFVRLSTCYSKIFSTQRNVATSYSKTIAVK